MSKKINWFKLLKFISSYPIVILTENCYPTITGILLSYWFPVIVILLIGLLNTEPLEFWDQIQNWISELNLRYCVKLEKKGFFSATSYGAPWPPWWWVETSKKNSKDCGRILCVDVQQQSDMLIWSLITGCDSAPFCDYRICHWCIRGLLINQRYVLVLLRFIRQGIVAAKWIHSSTGQLVKYSHCPKRYLIKHLEILVWCWIYSLGWAQTLFWTWDTKHIFMAALLAAGFSSCFVAVRHIHTMSQVMNIYELWIKTDM